MKKCVHGNVDHGLTLPMQENVIFPKS
uniref:Uncharacterized protein n=1 Tax=Anguilla anguilla TaxID=7936 RepID=A0A0E9S570_ANGAN